MLMLTYIRLRVTIIVLEMKTFLSVPNSFFTDIHRPTFTKTIIGTFRSGPVCNQTGSPL